MLDYEIHECVIGLFCSFTGSYHLAQRLAHDRYAACQESINVTVASYCQAWRAKPVCTLSAHF